MNPQLSFSLANSPTGGPTTAKPTSEPTTSSPTVTAAPTQVNVNPPPTPPPCLAEWADCTYDWFNCCDGYKCTQVDEWGYGRCLRDTCNDGPTPPPPTPPPPAPTNPPVAPPTAPTMPPAPTNPPTTSGPTPAADPPTSGEGCCTINLKTCHHEEGNFCRLSKENCEGPCGKLWLPSGPLDGCIALWEQGCSSDADCCQHGECREGSVSHGVLVSRSP